jgi:16S rRNA (guanine527-N7)-methyltransferase
VTEHQWGQLVALSLALKDWNSKVNMISRKDIDAIVPNHIVPSMAISLVKSFAANETIIDVGTGGGTRSFSLSFLYLPV